MIIDILIFLLGMFDGSDSLQSKLSRQLELDRPRSRNINKIIK